MPSWIATLLQVITLIPGLVNDIIALINALKGMPGFNGRGYIKALREGIQSAAVTKDATKLQALHLELQRILKS